MLHRTALTDKIMDAYKTSQETLRMQLNAECEAVCLTLDCWTGPGSKSFLAIAAHWVTPAYKDMHKLLAFQILGASHAAPVLSSWVKEVLISYDLQHKVLAITGDGASVNLAMHRSLAQQELCSLDRYIHCAAHVTNLIVQSALRSGSLSLVQDSEDDLRSESQWIATPSVTPVQRLRQLVIGIRRSSLRTKLLSSFCDNFQLENLSVILDCATRWSSTHAMLQRGLYLQEPLTALASRDKDLCQYLIDDEG